jgi:hypothetical protein
MVYTKGQPTINPWMSTVHNTDMDKRFHEWGQGSSFAFKMIEMLTNPGGIIFEPCLGGGTTAAVCKMLGRDYLAFEIDPTTAARARQRVEMTQPPLFVMQPEQAALFTEAAQ